MSQNNMYYLLFLILTSGKLVFISNSVTLCSLQKVYVIHWVSVDRHASTEEAYKDGRSRLKRLLSKVHNANV